MLEGFMGAFAPNQDLICKAGQAEFKFFKFKLI